MMFIPREDRIRAAVARSPSNKGFVRLVECEVCGDLDWSMSNESKPPEVETVPLSGYGRSCRFCDEVRSRAPEVVAWVMAVLCKQQDDAVMLAARPAECHHKWVNADNAHVEGTDLCLNCGAIRGRPGGSNG